ncbi:AfsR/SARP family transcriptional regulator [Nonomuraea endophytica]|uniref:Putative ATPase/DNA-binding SARP family transcriptional activator n=1 Tax=Nonomuraea endophytica TaxID=714136 RepID=A0A7W8EGY3_9ACTN|nr:BTAD domain-containing putative transcriptional regulator [Nonomuraea endophytica]MBB5079044.1 putative ATPase/DNA-binding SARP family transcriptional activator [Nonomuraea endophytica]
MAKVTEAELRAGVRVGVLGSLALETAAGPTPVGGARLRALLARLALAAGHAVRPAALIEDLWDETPPEAPLHALQTLVSRLRRLLGDPGLLPSGPDGYRLAVEPDAVDALRFERLAREARRTPADATVILREALSLWRGPALADVRSAPFAAAEAERLERARLAVLEDRIEADLALGPDLQLGADLDRAPSAGLDRALGADLDLVAELEALTAAHPLRERLHSQLIRALALTGRGGEALAAYERIRALLAESFGSDPGPHLREAHLAVLRGQPRRPPGTPDHPPGNLDRPSGSPDPLPSNLHRPPGSSDRPPGNLGRPPGNLDVPLTSFVGRDDDVRRVAGLLGRVRLVTLTGPGGSGKTRLANTVGRRLTPRGGVWFIPLAPVSADDVPRAVLDRLRAREEPGPARPVAPEEIVDRLADNLADDDVVLVLDNCEHVIEAAATLAATLLGRCPRLRVVATSREPLRIDGENLHPVLPLELPDPGSTTAQARACAAVRLFADRAAAVRPGFTLDGDALTAAVEICRRLDGLPLAIELAAARLRALPVEAVAARLDDRFRLLSGGSRTALPRHQTLSAAVAWSWDLLETDERTLLERLAVVPGTFTEDAAAAIGGTDDVGELLTALVDKSLLHPAESADPLRPRYRMLETIREYGLRRQEQPDAVRDRHARFFLHLAETADPYLRTADQLRWLARLDAERDNLAAAIRWAAESGDADLAVRLGVALSWFWFLRDHPPESLDLLGRVLQVRGASDPAARALVVAAHALATTETISRPEESEAAFAQIRTALELAAPGAHPVLEMAGLALAIGSDANLPNPSDGRVDLPGSSGERGELRSRPGERVDLPGRSGERADLWSQPGERANLPALSGERVDLWGRSLTLLVRGVLTMNAGQAADAAQLLSEALTGFEGVGERWGLGTTLSTLSTALRRSGDPDAALGMAERAGRCFQELGMAEHTMESEVAAATHLAEAGDVEGGRRQFAYLLERVGSAESRAQVCLGLARLEWRAGKLDAAREHAMAGLAEAAPGRSTPHLAALLLAVLAHVDAAEGHPEQAVRRLDHPAVHVTLTWNTPVAATIAVALAAGQLLDHRERAGQLLGEQLDHRERAGRLLGAAIVLRGWDEPGDADVRAVTRRAAEALGAAGFAAAHAAGAAMSRAEAEGLVSAIISGPVS